VERITGDMSSRDAAELKAEGAIEAAQNTESQVTAEDAQREMVEQSKNAGVAAFSFNPDASPEEKRAQAKAVRQTHRCALQH
jgi:hypothetical protein